MIPMCKQTVMTHYFRSAQLSPQRASPMRPYCRLRIFVAIQNGPYYLHLRTDRQARPQTRCPTIRGTFFQKSSLKLFAAYRRQVDNFNPLLGILSHGHRAKVDDQLKLWRIECDPLARNHQVWVLACIHIIITIIITVQCRSRTSMLIPQFEILIISACYNKQICLYFSVTVFTLHKSTAAKNNVSQKGCPSFTSLFERNFLTQRHKISLRNARNCMYKV